MNLRLIYLYRNLSRNPLRTVLTCMAVALPIVIYVLSMSVVDGLQLFLENSVKQLRLAITQKTSIVNPLPAGHRAKIEALDPSRKHIVAVCGLRYIGGQRPGEPVPLSTLAVDHDTFVAAFPENNLTPQEIEEWNKHRQAIMVGQGTAADMGWKVGDRITIFPSVPPYVNIEFRVVSTLPDATDIVTNWCRRDYLEEILKKEYPEAASAGGSGEGPFSQVTFFFVKCASKADLDLYRRKIDEAFRGSRDETKTQDEKTFMNEFIKQQFDLEKNLTLLSGITVLVAVLAAANTMSMNFRDRINEVATLKSLGFGGGFAFTLIQTESLLLCAIGGLIGSLGPFIAFSYTPLKNWTIPFIQTLQ
ncbi:MAG TPA: ABC transporter permease, partial [Phycisphaerae bacterium]|nr:ABC transporter permease [Phycisphaerae bacterium]